MREHTHTIDDIGREAASGITRRRSLVSLGGAVFATALASPSQTQAGKRGKKAKKQAKKKCKRQDGQCAAFFEELCTQDECEPGELEIALECCALLRTCRTGEYLECLFDVLRGSPEPQ